jgi:vancomycin permeability regulator SanA
LLAFLGDLLWVFIKFPMQTKGRILQADHLPPMHVPVLILGASVLPDREPSPLLLERLQTSLALFKAGSVDWILVSGDNRSARYNEPQSMRRWLLRQGVPPTLIVCDYAGRRTYDSLKRAQAVFGTSKLVVVTSDFHLNRAIYTARHLGLDAYGVAASTQNRSLWAHCTFWFREYGARHKALLDVWFPPDTLLGPREPTPSDWLTPNTDSGKHADERGR